MLNSLGLGFVFTAKDLASGTMRRVEGRFTKLDATTSAAAKSFKRNVGTMVAGLGIMAAGAIGVGTAFDLASKYGSFEKGLAKVGAITRATESDLAALKERALQAGLDTQFSPDEAVAGLGELGVRGFNAAQATQALGGALDLAAGGEISVAQASSTTAAALRVFGKDAGYATEAADKLLKISNITALQAGDLEVALGSVARGAISGKQGIDEMLVSVGLVRNAGNEASKSANAISSSIQFMAKERDKFTKLGVALDDASGQMRNLLDIYLETDKALNAKGLTGTKRVKTELELFGRFGQLGFAASVAQLNAGVQTLDGRMLQGAAAVAYLRKEMATASGTAAKFREQLLDTFEGQKILLRGSMQTLGVVVGEAFATSLKPIVSGVITVVNALIKVIKNTPAPIKKAIGITFLLVSTIVMLTGAVLAGVAAFALIKMAVVAFAGPLLVLGKILAVAVGAGLLLAGVFATLKLAYDRNIGGFGDKINALVDKVRLFIDAVGQLTSGDGKLRGNVLLKLLDPANAGVLSLVQRFQQLRYRIGKFIDGVKEGFSLVMDTAGPTFSALGDALTELFEALGFGSKGFELMKSKSDDWFSSGQTIGMLIGDLARLFINGLTVAVRLVTGAVVAFQHAWVILSPLLLMAWWLLDGVMTILGAIVSVFADTTEGANTTGGAFGDLTKVIGYGLGIWLAVKGAVMAARIAMLAYRGTLIAVSAAQTVFAAKSVLMRAATAHPIAAAFGLGVALGTAIDQYFGISDAMADYLVSLTKEGKEVAKLEEAYRKTLKVRGQIAAFDSLEAAAKARGMSVAQHVEDRATQIASESRAKELGLDKDEIALRLMAGEEIYQQKDYEAVAAERGVEVIRTAATGEADQAKAQQRQQADAFEQALARAEKSGRPVKFQANLNIDKQQVAQILKDAQAEADAMDFEADFALGT